MEYKVFEGRVLELFFKTGDRVTAQLAAYKIGVPVEEAREMLESMATRDIVSMESDDNGVIYFDLPNRPPPTLEPLSWQQRPAMPAAVPGYPMAGAAPMAMVPVYMPPIVPPEKSVAAAAILSFFFGPFGMFYSTVSGGLVMLFAGTLFVLLTMGLGIFLYVPTCVIWASLAADAHNKRVQSQLATLQAQSQLQLQYAQHVQRQLPPQR